MLFSLTCERLCVRVLLYHLHTFAFVLSFLIGSGNRQLCMSPFFFKFYTFAITKNITYIHTCHASVQMRVHNSRVANAHDSYCLIGAQASPLLSSPLGFNPRTKCPVPSLFLCLWPARKHAGKITPVLSKNFRRLGLSTGSSGGRKKAYAAVNDIDISCIE